MGAKVPLYYVAWTKKQLASLNTTDLNYIDAKYINVSITYTDEDEQRSWQSLKCYKSQFTNTEIKEFIEKGRNEKTKTYYFRRFAVEKKRKKDYF